MKFFYAKRKGQEQWSGPFDTREEAIAEARTDGYPFFVDTGTQPDAFDMVPSAGDIVEDMGEFARDNHGECADEFPDVSTAGLHELDALLKTWCDKHVSVNFWVCDGNVETIEAPDV